MGDRHSPNRGMGRTVRQELIKDCYIVIRRPDNLQQCTELMDQVIAL